MRACLPVLGWFFLPLATLHAEPAVAPAASKPLWPVVFGMTLLVQFTLPFMLRSLWPSMKRKTAWLIATGAALVFLFVLSPVAVAISNVLRSGRTL
jgi:quinol-cytochrome oxidoreductase complex cytochrome b subunit